MRIRELTATPAGRIEERLAITALIAPCITLACVAVLWAMSIQGLDLRQMDDFGLVSVLPVTYFAALAFLLISFGLAINTRKTPEWLLLLHVVALIAIIHGTPSLAYGTLRYSWAWKHIGMVDYIQRHGTVDPSITSLAGLSANHNWPGFFALGALLTEGGGFSSAIQFAPLAPLFFNLIDIGPLLLIAGAFVRDRRLKWLAVWVFFLGNWIGQDYFAPQAMSYFLLLVAIGVVLTWFGGGARPAGEPSHRWPLLARLEPIWQRLGLADEGARRGDNRLRPLQRAGLMALIIVLLGAIASSHQLTPFIAILSFGALVLVSRTRARGLPVLMAVITATWMLYVAWAFVGGNLQWMIASFGQLDRNSSVTPLAQLSRGQAAVAMAARGLTVLVGALGAAGFARRWLGGQRDLAYAALIVAPFPMLVASSYGGEMNFRVYFFALPYLAFFAAALFYPAPGAGRSWTAPLSVIGISGILIAGLLLAYDGRERMNYFTQNEVDAAHYLYDNAPAGSLIVGASYNYPSLFQDYERYTHVSLTGVTTSKGQLARLQNDPINTIVRLMSDRTYPASYLIVTRSQKAHIDLDNLLPSGKIERIEELLMHSADLKVIYRNEDAEIFVLAGQAGAGR